MKLEKPCFENFCNNLTLILSAIAFLLLNIDFSKSNNYSFLISSITIIVLFSCIKINENKIITNNRFIKLISFFSCVGLCLFLALKFQSFFTNYLMHYFIQVAPGYALSYFATIITVLLALMSGYIIYKYLIVLYCFLISKSKSLFNNIKKYEIIVYLLIIIVQIIFVSFVSIKTNAFNGYNIYNYSETIYTYDSGPILTKNAFLDFYHQENDFRQPFFMIFAFPFMSVGYLISFVTTDQLFSLALLYSYIQIILLFVSNYMIAKSMKLKPLYRLCFLIAWTFTYTMFLSSLVIEQYVIAYFYLAFFIYLYANNRNVDKTALFMARKYIAT